MTNRNSSICYKFLTITSLSLGIFLNISNTKSVVSLVSYYTLQSNILCLVFFVVALYIEIKYKTNSSNVYYILKGQVIIAIFITALIYGIALAPVGFDMTSVKTTITTSKELANLLVHTISPTLVVLDYFWFDKKGHFKVYYPFLWLIFPISYVSYVYTYSYRGGRFYGIGGSRKYAYWFLDYETIGKIGVFRWIVIVALVILGLSYILYCYDVLRGKEKEG